MSVGASYGLCFFMQIFFADMHPIIPFLLLGVGVDDMFIIVQARVVHVNQMVKLAYEPSAMKQIQFSNAYQSLENLSPEEKALPIPHKIALTMKHAGVAITVTSLTDMGAFLIAASSVSSGGTSLSFATHGSLMRCIYVEPAEITHFEALLRLLGYGCASPLLLRRHILRWVCLTLAT